MGHLLFFFFSAERDGCSPDACHAKCNNLSPLLVIASNTAGYVFGGYARYPRTDSGTVYICDPSAFLFRLKKANQRDCMKFLARNDNLCTVVSSFADQGPLFGNTSGKAALKFFSGEVTKQAGKPFFVCSNLSVNFANGFQNNGQDNNALTGGNNQLLNIEVYHVEGMYIDKGKLILM